jgi:acetyl esterase
MSPILDPELAPLLANAAPLFDGEARLPAQRRAVVEAFQRMAGPAPAPRIIRLARRAGPGDIELRLFATGGKRPAAAIYTMHGGGFVMGSAAMMDAENWRLAEDNQATVVAVDYRLAPETSFPGPLEDCYAGLVWLFENAASLGVDRNRVVIMGESAGGGLAAATMLMARDRNEVRPAAQLLVYPMLDHRTAGSPHASETGPMGWMVPFVRFGWSAMQGTYAIDDERATYFSPALADDLSDLPPTFIAVGALDLFAEESLEYARRLLRAGVPVECHVYPGAVHGFDKFRGTSIAKQFQYDQQQALTRWLHR